MTVTSQLTNVTAAEAADDAAWDNIGGGQGSVQSDDNPVQGSENRGRRVDNATIGFSFDNASGIDISGTDVHVGFWVWVVQAGSLTTGGVELRLGDNTTPTADNWDGHTFASSEYPPLRSWLRIWLDPTRTRDQGSGTLSLSNVRQFGAEFDMLNVGGNSPNCNLDSIDYTSGGLLIDAGTVGTPTTFQDAVDEDEINRQGVIESVSGVFVINARITIADATTTVFNDSGFNIIFFNQPLAAADFMGITIDLQNASTDIDLADGSIASGASTLGDFIVTGTSGDLTAARVNFSSIRDIILTSACTLTGCSITSSGAVTVAGADLNNSSILNTTGTAGIIWDTNADPNGELDDMSFTSNGDTTIENHGIQLDSNTPASISLTGHAYTSYFTDDEDNTGGIGFDTETEVTGGATDTVTITTHPFSTQDSIFYGDDGGTETIGLTDGTQYWVRSIDANSVAFYTSASNADTDTSRISLTPSGAGNGEIHKIFSANATIYNNTGKALTITILGGGDVPSVRNEPGSTVTVVANTQITLTGLINLTEVRVYNPSGSTTESNGQEDVTTGTFVFSEPNGDSIDMRIFAVDYEPADILNFTVPATDSSIPVQQRFDRNKID